MKNEDRKARAMRVKELAGKKDRRGHPLTPLSAFHAIRAAVRDVPSDGTCRFVWGVTEDALPSLETLSTDAPALADDVLALVEENEALKEENARLREAFLKFAIECYGPEDGERLFKTRAALAPKKEEE